MNFPEIEAQVESEYNQERNPYEFMDWALSCFSRVRGKCNNVQFQRSRILKVIREEAWPLRVFLKNNPNAFTSVQVFNGSQNYDGIGRLGSDSSFIEIICFKDGQFDLFQAEHMDEFGSAPASGITKEQYREATATKNPAIGDCVYSGDEIKKALDGTIKSIKKKNSKKYNENTILIVGIDGISSFMDVDTWKEYCEKISIFTEDTQFSMIYSVCLLSENCYRIK